MYTCKFPRIKPHISTARKTKQSEEVALPVLARYCKILYNIIYIM